MAFSFYSLLTSKTRFLGLRLYVVLIAVFALCLTVSFLAIFIRIWLNRWSRLLPSENASRMTPLVSKEIGEVRKVENDLESVMKLTEAAEEEEKGVDHKKRSGSGGKVVASSSSRSGDVVSVAVDFQGNIGWGRWYTMKELEIATARLSAENIIGEGGYGIVYRGILDDGLVVAVKNLLDKKYESVPSHCESCAGFKFMLMLDGEGESKLQFSPY